MKPITISSWGYYGRGNHTPYLIKALDSAEESRAFIPLIFVGARTFITLKPDLSPYPSTLPLFGSGY